MSTYQTLKSAIQSKKCVTAEYNGGARHFSPHSIGLSGEGIPMTMVFQYDGYSASGLPVGGQWRCLEVFKIKNAVVNDHIWHTNDNHTKKNTCVIDIDVQVV